MWSICSPTLINYQKYLMKYKYNNKNLLIYKENYMYTSFEGVDFINCYLEDRKLFISKYENYRNAVESDNLDSIQIYRFIIKRIEEKYPFSNKYFDAINLQLSNKNIIKIDKSKYELESLKNFLNKDKIITNNLLNSLVNNILFYSKEKINKIFVDKITHKFEVSKRIYSRYSKNLMKGEKSNTNLVLYWKFGIVLSAFYSCTSNFKYLSALIKICDVISSSEESEIKSSILDKELNLLFIFENAFIKILLDEHAIKYDY